MKHILIALLLASSTAHALAQTWGENATMQLSTATSIQYGAGQAWATKTVGPGAVVCNNATFGDAAPNVVKSCRVAWRYKCMPAPGGEGSLPLARVGTKGSVFAYYCPGDELPHLFVCLRPTCVLVASTRAFAALLSNPTLAGLNEAMAPYTRNVYSDPELIAVWRPYAAEIRALVP
jgi:hypothetical protein